VQVGYHHPAPLFVGPPTARLVHRNPRFLPAPLIIHGQVIPAAADTPVRHVHVPRRVHAVRHYMINGPIVRCVRVAGLLDLDPAHVTPRISRDEPLHLAPEPFGPWTMRALAFTS